MSIKEMRNVNSNEVWEKYFSNLRKRLEGKFISDPSPCTIDDLKVPKEEKENV